MQESVETDQVELDEDNLPSTICMYDENWHQGLLGILAARIKEKYHRPCIVFAKVSDDEFEIVDVVEGTGQWAGAAKKIEIKLPDGRTQGAGIDGSYERNVEIFENKNDYIGGIATVRYFRFTKDNFLYIPVVKDINRHD